jgi:hypothetical protein
MTSTTPVHLARETRPQHTDPATSVVAAHAPGAHAGDLARRVTHRRNEIGLSTEELALRAGVDAWFLAYFERSADTTLTGGALLRVAAALGTTPMALEGGNVDRPPGAGRAGAHPVLENLSVEQCKEHLAAGGIGRIVLSTKSGPLALPVNFNFAGGSIIFRTSDAMVRNIAGVVAFEVDRIDEEMSEGWSVLVRGRARRIEEPTERLAVGQLDPEPWAGGARLNLIGITPLAITGRIIVQHQSTKFR